MEFFFRMYQYSGMDLAIFPGSLQRRVRSELHPVPKQIDREGQVRSDQTIEPGKINPPARCPLDRASSSTHISHFIAFLQDTFIYKFPLTT